MKRILIASGCLVWFFLLYSCGKSNCIDPGLELTFRGYDSAELSRVMIAQYLNDDSFKTLVTITVHDTAYKEVRQSNDTVYAPMVDSSGNYLAQGYDYIVWLPYVHKSFFADSAFTISKVSYTSRKQKTPGSGYGGCTNNATYYLDTIPYMVAGSSFSSSSVPGINIVLNK